MNGQDIECASIGSEARITTPAESGRENSRDTRVQSIAEGGADARLDPDLPHFTNRECPYFPCHEGIEPHLFNCLFCFCPLYALGADGGGAPVFGENGVKDCSRCTLPHRGNAGNRLVNDKFAMLSDLARKAR